MSKSNKEKLKLLIDFDKSTIKTDHDNDMIIEIKESEKVEEPKPTTVKIIKKKKSKGKKLF